MKKGETRKAEILQAASDLFERKGYRAATLQDIIDSVKCSKGSVYHHFDSKLSIMQTLCRQRSEEGYRMFNSLGLPAGLEKLDRLLYYSCPFRKGEEVFLASRISLAMQHEGAVLAAHIRETQKRVFFPDLTALLNHLRQAGLAHFSHPALPELLWDTHMAFGDALLEESCRLLSSGGTPASRMAQMLAAARFQWERLLDLPFGCVTIAELDELRGVMEASFQRAKLEEGQLRFDAGYALACQGPAKTV